MLFNRYVVVLLAGFQGLSQAANLRKGAAGERRLNAEFSEIVDLLSATYGSGSCTTHVAGEYDPMETPTTRVKCVRPGGWAALIGMGALGKDRVTASSLRVCEMQVDGIDKCSTLRFTGDAKTDLQDASAFLKGLLTSRKLVTVTQEGPSEFEWMTQTLNATFGFKCQLYVIGGVVVKGRKDEIATAVACTRPGGTAYLAAGGEGASAKARSLEVCMYGAEMNKSCRTAHFTGDEKKDKEEFYKLVGNKSGDDRKLAGGSPIVGTDFDMLVELLNGIFENKCETTVVGLRALEMTTVISCTRPGGDAKLAAMGSTENPKPTLLQVCDVGDDMKAHNCHKLKLTGDTTKDLPAAKKMLMK
jgi:hypothetical protein